jgi:hypothetical protein
MGLLCSKCYSVEAGASIEALIGNEGEQLDLYAKSIICEETRNAELLNECRRVILEGL